MLQSVAALSTWCFLYVLCALYCRSPGVTGTLAVVFGYLLKLDPFGGLHWDPGHVAVGVACAAPLVFLGKPPIAAQGT